MNELSNEEAQVCDKYTEGGSIFYYGSLLLIAKRQADAKNTNQCNNI